MTGLFYKRRRVLVLLLDVLIFIGAYAGAYLVRSDLAYYPGAWGHFERTLLTLLVVKSLVFVTAGMYRGLMLHATIHDLLAIVRTSTFASAVVAIAFHVLTDHRPYSRGVLAIDWMLTIGLISASRLGWRMFRDGMLQLPAGAQAPGKRVLVVGAGRAGVALAKDLLTSRRGDVDLIGFVDDDPEKQQATLLGRPILGTTRDIPDIRMRRPVDQIIVAIPSAPPRVLRRIAELSRGVEDFRVVPPLDALLRGDAAIVQSVSVNDEVFLSRDAVDLAVDERLRFFEDKSVLVTGAGGSIGSELARQLAQLGRPVRKLLLLDCAETPLYDIHRQTRAVIGPRAVPVLASVRDLKRMAELLATEMPDVILHAAALKHVPMCEHHPLEAAATNSWATARLADLAHELDIPNFTLVSTDKAVAPSCVMGASKRAAETYVQSLAQSSHTRMAAVRFGNVLGSNGSVLPLFHEQIAKGGPVTVTDPTATRYFMTIPEACGLILQATRIAQGGEIYVLDMGEPVRILDVAHNLIRLYGYEPGRDIEVKIIGLRPGEKLHESLVDEAEVAEPVAHAKLMRIRSRTPSRQRCRDLMIALERAIHDRDEEVALRVLCLLVPTFNRVLEQPRPIPTAPLPELAEARA